MMWNLSSFSCCTHTHTSTHTHTAQNMPMCFLFLLLLFFLLRNKNSPAPPVMGHSGWFLRRSLQGREGPWTEVRSLLLGSISVRSDWLSGAHWLKRLQISLTASVKENKMQLAHKLSLEWLGTEIYNWTPVLTANFRAGVMRGCGHQKRLRQVLGPWGSPPVPSSRPVSVRRW